MNDMKYIFYTLFLVFPFFIKAQTTITYSYKISYTSDNKTNTEEIKAWIQKFTHADYLSLNLDERVVYVETTKPLNKNIVLNKLIKVNVLVNTITETEYRASNGLTSEQKEKLKQELEVKVKELESKIK